MARLPLPLIAAVVAFGLAGCSVPDHGSMGLYRDDDGQLQAIVQMCEGHVDSAVIYTSDRYSQTWDFPARVTGLATVTLTGAESSLNPSLQYSSFAGSTDNTSSARGPQFSTTEITDLQPGEVLAKDEDGDFELQVMTADDFADMVLRNCD